MKNLDVAGKIRAYREKHSLTQKQFAKLLGVTHQAVSKWERETGFPDVVMLPKLAQILGCSIEELYIP